MFNLYEIGFSGYYNSGKAIDRLRSSWIFERFSLVVLYLLYLLFRYVPGRSSARRAKRRMRAPSGLSVRPRAPPFFDTFFLVASRGEVTRRAWRHGGVGACKARATVRQVAKTSARDNMVLGKQKS